MSPHSQESMTHPEFATFMTDILLMAEYIYPENRSVGTSKTFSRLNNSVYLEIKTLSEWGIVFSIKKDKVAIKNRQGTMVPMGFHDVIKMCSFLDTVMTEVQPEWSNLKMEASE